MTMRQYDDVIIGSGITGLTLAVILGLNGHKVLLLEKSSKTGGALRRFKVKGMDFDTGFHFTGGLNPDEIFYCALKLLTVDREVLARRVPLKLIYYLPESNRKIVIHSGLANVIQTLAEYFPDERENVDRFFKYMFQTFKECGLDNFLKLIHLQDLALDDSESLENVLNRFFKNHELKMIFSGFSMCYGVSPKEFSFTNYVRIAGYLFESFETFEKGGDTLFEALNQKIQDLSVDVQTSSYPTGFEGFEGKTAKRIVLNTGEIVEMKQCIFTIHPKDMIKVLPAEFCTNAFKHRIQDFQDSNGFFSVYGKALIPNNDSLTHELHMIYPHSNINAFFSKPYPEDGGICFFLAKQNQNGQENIIFTGLESMFSEQVKHFKNSYLHKRSEEYERFKQNRTEKFIFRIENYFKNKNMKLIPYCSATPLTFRDYLNNYDGAAYGIKQLTGQFSVFGRLKLRNLYACGQNAFLPGILGSLSSGIVICRQILGEKHFDDYCKRKLS